MENIIIDVNKDVLFFDISYVVFYRYFAVYYWAKLTGLDLEGNVMENKEFVEKYDKMFCKCFCEIVKKTKCCWSNVFVVRDCSRSLIWRNDYYSEYKATRNIRPKDDIFNKEIFVYTYDVILPRLLKQYDFHVIQHERLEADDIIALSKMFVRNLNKNVKINIVTNDNDYIQLLDNNTIIKNLQGKELRSRITTSPELYLKIKCLCGDRSDNINSCIKRIGAKKVEKIVNDPDNFEKLYLNNDDIVKNYNLNKLLIDFNLIPNKFRDPFEMRLINKNLINI